MPLYDEVKAAEWDAAMASMQAAKSEWSEYERYCQQRDMGFAPGKIAHLFKGVYASCYEQWYCEERRSPA